jgi:hypothetical protein
MFAIRVFVTHRTMVWSRTSSRAHVALLATDDESRGRSRSLRRRRALVALASSPLLDVAVPEREPGTLRNPTTTTDDSAPPVPDPDPDAPPR